MDKNFRAGNLVVLFIVLIASGCAVLRTEPFVDAVRDANGAVIFLDTPRSWRDWQQAVGYAIEREAAGKGPGGGIPTWNEQWLRVIEANRTRENSQRYIDYIIQARKRAGLPDLMSRDGREVA